MPEISKSQQSLMAVQLILMEEDWANSLCLKRPLVLLVAREEQIQPLDKHLLPDELGGKLRGRAQYRKLSKKLGRL